MVVGSSEGKLSEAHAARAGLCPVTDTIAFANLHRLVPVVHLPPVDHPSRCSRCRLLDHWEGLSEQDMNHGLTTTLLQAAESGKVRNRRVPSRALTWHVVSQKIDAASALLSGIPKSFAYGRTSRGTRRLQERLEDFWYSLYKETAYTSTYFPGCDVLRYPLYAPDFEQKQILLRQTMYANDAQEPVIAFRAAPFRRSSRRKMIGRCERHGPFQMVERFEHMIPSFAKENKVADDCLGHDRTVTCRHCYR